MSKTLIVGDSHIGGSQNQGKPADSESLNSRIVDQSKILNWIITQSVYNNVERIILTGDIFDEAKPDPRLVLIFTDWLRSCADHGIECHIITGNHDIKRIGATYQSTLDVISAMHLENVSVYNSISTIELEDVSFTFLPFRDKRSLNVSTVSDAIAQIREKVSYEAATVSPNKLKILIGHMALEGSIYSAEIDDTTNEIICPLNMFVDYDYVWMGHVHKPQLLSRTPYMAHIGSMDISDFGETLQQKIVIIVEPNSDNVFSELIIPSRPLRRVRLEIPADKDPAKHIIDHINAVHENFSFKDAIVKLEIKLLDPTAPDIDREAVIAALNQVGAYHIAGFVESKTVSVLPDDKRDLVDESIEPKNAIKIWAELQKLTEEDKNKFITLAVSIMDECLKE